MNFGLMMIWNWVIGLVLFFPACGIVYFILQKKYGKDVMDRLDSDGGFDGQCLFYAAIATLLWEASFPVLFYIMFRLAKEMSELMHK